MRVCEVGGDGFGYDFGVLFGAALFLGFTVCGRLGVSVCGCFSACDGQFWLIRFVLFLRHVRQICCKESEEKKRNLCVIAQRLTADGRRESVLVERRMWRGQWGRQRE